MTQPIITMTLTETSQEMSLVHGIAFLMENDMQLIGGLTLIFCVISPLLRIYFAFLCSLLIHLKLGKGVATSALRFYFMATKWDMLDIFWIALLVSLVKLGDLADVTINFGMFYLSFFVCMAFATKLSLDPRSYWKKIAGI